MDLKLIPLRAEHEKQFKADMREAFQLGGTEVFGDTDEEVLPESHIDRSLSAKGAAAYEALDGEELVGGAIVVIDEKEKRGNLDFLYVKHGIQSKGIGQRIWRAIEEKYPGIKAWETVTPYFEKRNIHFYVNRCGFHIVEFFNKQHPDPNDPDMSDGSSEYMDEYFEGMFRFEKVMK